MTKPILVTAGIIRKDNKILIAQRKSDSHLEANKWEFPGGKVEYCEHPEDCLKREIMEELNINIKVNNLFTTVSHVYEKDDKKSHIILMCYLSDWIDGEVDNIDCQDSRWVSIEELKDHEFAEADRPIIKKLMEKTYNDI